MDITQRLLLGTHILCGLVGLLTMLPPLLSRKGARLHRRVGWAFTAAMSGVCVTGLGLAALWMMSPARYRPDLTADAARLYGAFLVLIALLTGNALMQAITSLARKRHHAPRRRFRELLPLVALASWALLCRGLGLAFGHMLMVVFAVGSLASVVGDARFTLRPLPSPHAHVYQHINATGTACISAVTAFLVLGGRRWITVDVLGDSAWLLWVAPGVVLGAVFRLVAFWYKRKLERPKHAARGLIADAHG